MNKVRSLGLVAAVGAVAVLTGCAAGPGYYGDPGYSGYSQPYYSDPLVVTPPPVYIQGGGYYGGGGRPYYREPYYGGRDRDYPDVRPGYGPRPGFVPPRPAVQAQPRTPPGYPRPVIVPPSARGAPPAAIQPSWNNKEQP